MIMNTSPFLFCFLSLSLQTFRMDLLSLSLSLSLINYKFCIDLVLIIRWITIGYQQICSDRSLYLPHWAGGEEYFLIRN